MGLKQAVLQGLSTPEDVHSRLSSRTRIGVDGIAATGELAKLLDAYRGERSWGQLQTHDGDSSGLSPRKEAVMMFRFRSMSQEDAEAIARWHYPEPFSFYDWAADPNDLAELLDPTARGDGYFAVEDEDGSLIGFFHFKTPHGPRLEIGLGLHPERTGSGS